MTRQGHLNQRGAIIIQVAVVLLSLIAFSAFVVDFGVMWVSRRHAQNAADAGALAGAISLQYDGYSTPKAKLSAEEFTVRNAIWTSSNVAGSNIVVGVSGTGAGEENIPPCGTQKGCARVDVFRNAPDRNGTVRGTPIPTFFGPLIGINGQRVRATATAWVGTGNAVECIKPWVVADRWTDNSGTGSNTSGWDQQDFFNPGVDTYTGLGFSAQTDVGLQLMLKGEGRDWSSGWHLEIDLGGGNGGSVYRDEIAGCPNWVPTVGLYAPPTPCNDNPDTDPTKGCLNVKTGVKQGPTTSGVGDLVALDTGAYWDTTTNTVTGGCTSAGNCGSVNPTGVSLSPRIVPIALFNPQAYADGGFTGNGGMARVTNLLGFFVEGMCDQVYATPPVWCGTGADPAKTVVGRLMKYPGQAKSASGPAGPGSFITIIQLVR